MRRRRAMGGLCLTVFWADSRWLFRRHTFTDVANHLSSLRHYNSLPPPGSKLRPGVTLRSFPTSIWVQVLVLCINIFTRKPMPPPWNIEIAQWPVSFEMILVDRPAEHVIRIALNNPSKRNPLRYFFAPHLRRSELTDIPFENQCGDEKRSL